MAKFVVLAGFTDQGIPNVKETVSRAICEAPDDEAATALSLSVCSRGNVRSETLRAFSFDEMKTILDKMV